PAAPWTTRPRSCPPPVAPGLPSAGRTLVADLDGDGCPDAARWDGRVLVARTAGPRAAPRRYEIGRPGDQLVLGDWNCDGTATPALYRSSDGSVLTVDEFARRVGDRVYASHTERRAGGGRAVAVARPGCGDLVRILPRARRAASQAPPARPSG
ncbi:MAG: serine/threonine protein kinase, partial [Acidimicrobiales bacterium]|nr:serine/threonine protein kinase [Acidimicrobiales bacterium]